MKIIFTTSLVFFFLSGYSQNPLHLTWTFGKNNPGEFELMAPANAPIHLTVSNKLSDQELQDFLEKTTIRKVNANGEEQFNESLAKRIQTHGKKAGDLIKDNRIDKLDIAALIGQKFAGEVIFIHPYLGVGENGHPVVPVDQQIKISFSEEIEHPGEDVPTDDLHQHLIKECDSCKTHENDLVYDFTCKKLFRSNKTELEEVTDLRKVKVKFQRVVHVKVIGVNRYLYDVNTKVADSIYGSETPKLFGHFFSGSSDLYSSLIDGAKVQTEKLSGDTSQAKKDSAKKEIDRQFDALKTAIAKFKNKYNRLLDRQITAYLYCMDPTIKCCGEPDDIATYSAHADLLSDVMERIAKIEAQFLTDIPGSAKILSDIQDNQSKLEACKANVEKSRKELAEAKDDAAKKAADEKLKKAIADCDEKSFKDKIAKLEASLPIRITLDQMKSSLPTPAQLRKLYLFVRNINKDHFIYRLPPIYPQGDRLTINIDLQARDTTITNEMGFMPTYHDELNLEFSVRRKPSFAFSSGPFFAFGSDVSAPSYGFKRIPASGTVIGTDAKYRLDRTGSEPLPIGLGAFAHMGYKVDRNIGVAGTVGVGYTFNQQNVLPAFMLGGTVSFGDRQRFNLTIGGAAVQVKELKEELYLGNVYDAAPELEYHKPIRFGYFASISYSVFTSTSKVNLFSRSKN